jgi:hypothetical protein
MNRRQFLNLLVRTSVALAIAPAITQASRKVSPYERVEKDIYREIVYLDKPLLIENINGITISHCHFIQTKAFEGPMMIIRRCNNTLIRDCRFDSMTAFSNHPLVVVEG